MGRMPYNVHVFPYSLAGESPRFCLFERSDFPGVWQGVCGGGEAGESVQEAALRECLEEGAISEPGPLYPLDSVSVMRSSIFPRDCARWGHDVVVLPMYYFAMPYEGSIAISDEHLAYRWVSYEEGDALIRYPDQNTALWELAQRLRRGNLHRSIPACMTVPWKSRHDMI